MENQPRRDELRRELRQRGLPPAYIERLLSELDDHFTDLLEERNSRMGAARKLHFDGDDLQNRLGEPTQLAVFVADQYHGRTFWGRHPVMTFLLGPLPMLVVMWAAYFLATGILAACIAWIGGRISNWPFVPEDHLLLQAIMLTLFTWGLVVLSPLVTALMLCRVYQRNALQIRWPVLGCTLLAIAVTMLHFTWRLHTGPSAAEQGLFMVGVAGPWSEWSSWLATLLAVKFAAALGIGLLVVQRAQQQLAVEA